MNIYNVIYPYGNSGIITAITIALNAFDAQKKTEFKMVKHSKKGIKIETKNVFGMKGIKTSVASIDDIQHWLDMLKDMDEPELISNIRTILEKRIKDNESKLSRNSQSS